jgi:predicted phage terminase large subunit-like protein
MAGSTARCTRATWCTWTTPGSPVPILNAAQVPDAALDELVGLLDYRVPCGGLYGPGYLPSVKQQAFLSLSGREALYGGAAGGGKSDALLRAALQYVCVPGYAALLFRQTYPQLVMDGGLVERAEQWLGGTSARRVKAENRWVFPSGASLTLGHLERDADRFKYAGATVQYLGWDELTNWPSDKVYRFLASRLRRPRAQDTLEACPTCGLTLADVPLRIRSGSNPGGAGEGWVHERFVKPWERWQLGEGPAPDPERLFMPAFLYDNPGLDVDGYLESLGLLDATTLAQLRDGVWGARANELLKRSRVRLVDAWPREARLVRGWDFAATEAEGTDDPDWTVGVLLAEHQGQWWVVHVERFRAGPGDVETRWLQRVQADRAVYGPRVRHRLEQEPGSAGKMNTAHLVRLARGHPVKGQPSTGSKVDRARPLAAAIDNDNFAIVADGSWDVDAYLDELEVFPRGTHDDQVDATTSAMAELTGGTGRGGLRS